ncbi:galectin-8-like isoform X2 [Poeciliopsis prolifica]|uniref:galectin-8-like isoform X2 n=1 Tax=Poeciliopsis prolifica TaxID=188132 RepID=UPI002413EF9D|nr:galectin-8-like isoform X2 [Poeciliopsis prolifica]
MSISNPRQVFSNPLIPFAGTILGGLLPEEMVLIQGSVPSGADRFQVDFTCGSSVKPRADVAFHFNPRLNKKRIVCNTLQKERWGSEEILYQMPLKVGAAFELVILVLKDKYKVAINGAHVLEYKHRVDLNRVDTILISGAVAVQALAVVPPASSPAAPASSLTSSASEAILSFRDLLESGLKVGRSIVIKGQTSPNANSFCVNLRDASGRDIIVHLNPRLAKRVFVRNSFLSECWGAEESDLEAFPFAAGKYFEMIIRSDTRHFRVAVNGCHQFNYKHRVQDLSAVRQLEVVGDVTLMEVQMT